MITQGYINAVKQIAWGYVFIYINLNLGNLNLLPAWLGFILIGLALPEIGKQEPSAFLLRGFSWGLAAYHGAVWLADLFDLEVNLPWIWMIVQVITLYYHFQLLTNLAQTAENFGLQKQAKNLRMLRTCQTILVTALGFGQLITANVRLGTGVILVMGCLLLVFLIIILIVLFSYAGDLRRAGLPGLPLYAEKCISLLEQGGHEAYAVGGCVRDCLMHKVPSDWDLCTSAKPGEIKECFRDYQTIDTGMKHGTVAVIMDGHTVEITTYRIDGDYRDGRHPEEVAFTASLKEDLARRDFTINAMAFHPDKGMVDPFGGTAAVRNREIVCVGAPEKRFAEDALRIMRGLRFASTLGFRISDAAAEAMRKYGETVNRVSRERVHTELSKLLLGFDADRVMTEYGDILKCAVPGLQLPKVELDTLPEILTVRLAAVFPEDTEKHLRNLKYSNEIVEQTSVLVRLFEKGRPPQETVEIKKVLAAEGEEIARQYFAAFQREELVQQVLDSGDCWNLKQLAVSGSDLIEAGVKPGRAVGELLNELLMLVIEEKLDNHRETLLEYTRRKVNL